jgi:hypothetical protein
MKINEKFCINCKHVVKSNSDPKYSKCSQFPLRDSTFLVTGNKTNSDFLYCSTVRGQNDMCGENTTKYLKKRVKNNFLD